MKTKKIIVAGPLVKEAIYPRGSAHDSPRARGAKRKLSSEAQQRMNAKYSWQELELRIAANIVPGDLWVTFTYDDAHLPRNRKEAETRFKYFLKKFCAARGGRKNVVAISCIEHKHEHEDRLQHRRWHHHVLLNATGDDYDLLRRCWIYGENIEIEPVRIDKEHSYEALARYMCKEAKDRPGLRSWSCTRNCRRPEVETFPVDDDTQLQPPKGATVYEDARESNEWGSWRYVKYLAPNWRAAVRRPKAKRKRRRR